MGVPSGQASLSADIVWSISPPPLLRPSSCNPHISPPLACKQRPSAARSALVESLWLTGRQMQAAAAVQSVAAARPVQAARLR